MLLATKRILKEVWKSLQTHCGKGEVILLPSLSPSPLSSPLLSCLELIFFYMFYDKIFMSLIRDVIYVIKSLNLLKAVLR